MGYPDEELGLAGTGQEGEIGELVVVESQVGNNHQGLWVNEKICKLNLQVLKLNSVHCLSANNKIVKAFFVGEV